MQNEPSVPKNFPAHFPDGSVNPLWLRKRREAIPLTLDEAALKMAVYLKREDPEAVKKDLEGMESGTIPVPSVIYSYYRLGFKTLADIKEAKGGPRGTRGPRPRKNRAPLPEEPAPLVPRETRKYTRRSSGSYPVTVSSGRRKLESISLRFEDARIEVVTVYTEADENSASRIENRRGFSLADVHGKTLSYTPEGGLKCE